MLHVCETLPCLQGGMPLKFETCPNIYCDGSSHFLFGSTARGLVSLVELWSVSMCACVFHEWMEEKTIIFRTVVMMLGKIVAWHVYDDVYHIMPHINDFFFDKFAC